VNKVQLDSGNTSRTNTYYLRPKWYPKAPSVTKFTSYSVRIWDEDKVPAVIREAMAVMDVCGDAGHPVYGIRQQYHNARITDELITCYYVTKKWVDKLIAQGVI
jgi:hypothetical protein